MLKDAVAVIDLGSYSLTAIIGENGVNNNYIIRALFKQQHEAFDGRIIDEKRLYNAISDSLRTVTHSVKAKIDTVYVGIPGEFLRVDNVEQRTFFNRKKRIREKDLKEFYEGATARHMPMGGEEVISKSGVCFYLDGNRRVDNPLGAVSTSLSGFVTIFTADGGLLTVLRKIFLSLGVKTVNFIPVPLAEGKLLFSDEERRSAQVLLDVGYLSTNLTVLSGDGALFHDSFQIGGGHVTAYLYDKLQIDFEVAERLKRKINLSIAANAGAYVVIYGEKQYTFNVSDVNEIARFVIDDIGEKFDRAILTSRVRLAHDTVVSLTGGGISYVRGCPEYFSGLIEMPVNVVAPKLAYMSKPDDSSALAVLNYALNEKLY